MPPTSIDGTDITGATIDGQDVQEITVDGDTVFSGIPDSDVNYDATKLTGFSDGDPIDTWPDEAGANDLSQATASLQPTYQTGEINGKPIVRYDGADDFHRVSFSTVSQPFQHFVVYKHRSNTINRWLIDGASTPAFYYETDGSNRREMFAGSAIKGSDDDTNPHILTTRFDGASSSFRIDGTTDASGNAGSNGLDGLTVGARNTNANHGDYDVGEILVFFSALSTSDRDAVESFLADKWGITI